LKSLLASSRKKLKEWNLPVREDSALEPVPVRIICALEPHTDIQGLIAEIRERSLASLLNFKDICSCPAQCRYLSLEVDRYPYFSKTPTREEIHYFYDRYPRKLYITKECALRVKGFRGISPNCPFKAESDLVFGEQKEKQKSRISTSNCD
jgi:hypothetical protein